jgi:ribonuclease R
MARDRAQGKQKEEKDTTIWDALGVHCSANERRADEASRDVEAWLKCYYMKDKLGEVFHGIISGVTPFGIFVQLEELYVEGLVHVTGLGSDYFQYDEARHELRGERTGKRYRLTDRVSVQIARVDLEARKIDLVLGGTEMTATPVEIAFTEEPEAAPRRARGRKPKAEQQSRYQPVIDEAPAAGKPPRRVRTTPTTTAAAKNSAKGGAKKTVGKNPAAKQAAKKAASKTSRKKK